MNALKEIPAHVWLFALVMILLGGYYVRPDTLTYDLVKISLGALLATLTIKNNNPPLP